MGICTDRIGLYKDIIGSEFRLLLIVVTHWNGMVPGKYFLDMTGPLCTSSCTVQEF